MLDDTFLRRCFARSTQLEEEGDPRFRDVSQVIVASMTKKDAWDHYGIANDVVVCSICFPRTPVLMTLYLAFY